MRTALARLAAALLASAALLAGCGQKGPLYFPDDAPKKQAAARTTPAAAPEQHGPL